MESSGLYLTLADRCNPLFEFEEHVTPYLIKYTGLRGLDLYALCPLVSFSHEAIAYPDAISFFTYFVGISAPLPIIPAVEGWRSDRSRYIAFPVIFGILCQTLTVGVMMPIYWLVFIVTGGVDRTKNPTVSQAHAESIVFGVLVGAVIPSIAMLILEDPQVTAIWQAYPIYVTLAQYALLIFRPASKHSRSGYSIIRALYISAFIVCSYIHISTIWPLLGNVDAVKSIFIPSRMSPDPSANTGYKVLHLLKWDLFFTFASSMFTTLWFAENLYQLFTLSAWIVVGTPVVGPGAVVTAAFLWRESQLQALRKSKKL